MFFSIDFLLLCFTILSSLDFLCFKKTEDNPPFSNFLFHLLGFPSSTSIVTKRGSISSILARNWTSPSSTLLFVFFSSYRRRYSWRFFCSSCPFSSGTHVTCAIRRKRSRMFCSRFCHAEESFLPEEICDTKCTKICLRRILTIG